MFVATAIKRLLEEILAKEAEHATTSPAPAQRVKTLSNCDQTATDVFGRFKRTNGVCCKPRSERQ